jgi:hypothetical protein
MKNFSNVSIAAVIFGATMIGNSAMAQVSSTANVRSTGYQLIDLDLNDGVSPWITFVNTSNAANAQISVGTYSDGFTSAASRNASSPRPIGVSVGDANAGAAASYSGGVFGSLASNGQTNDQGSYSANQSFNTSFVLSPKTILVYFGEISGTVSSAVPYYQNTQSSASASLNGSLLPGYGGQQSSSINNSLYNYYGGSNQFNQSFTLSFVNGNAVELNGNFSANTSTYGSNSIAAARAVPEPETYAMMLAGLAGLGFVARRKKAIFLK